MFAEGKGSIEHGFSKSWTETVPQTKCEICGVLLINATADPIAYGHAMELFTLADSGHRVPPQTDGLTPADRIRAKIAKRAPGPDIERRCKVHPQYVVPTSDQDCLACQRNRRLGRPIEEDTPTFLREAFKQ